ncbi:HEPN domain-containing protein [Paraflavitalea pollutisoli]|uniref:HEPN domain-containing protein n=1 Tax=Paraflavitalea pollutisoli TaxID=3034143 RepID=UPI0023EE2791|nr:HEPN domain-containing protein [Paraflavitalea sp. H1-2-19X]
MKTEFEDHFSNFEKVIDELCALSDQKIVHFIDRITMPLKIERASKEEVKRLFSRRTEKRYAKYFLKFSTHFTLNNEDAEQMPVFLAAHITQATVTHLLIYLNLAKPGAFDSRQGIVIKDFRFDTEEKTEKDSFPPLVNSIHLSFDLMKQYKWPQLVELKIEDTLKWLDKHWEAFNAAPTNRIERALNAFSYLFHETLADNSPSDLFFSLVGIEAMFVEGNESVQKQVNIKTQLLLGKRTEFKKKFGDLYEFRSRYVHGQLNFINKYYVRDADDKVQSHMFETHDNSYFAILILIASIQKHILLDKDSLEFEFVLKK